MHQKRFLWVFIPPVLGPSALFVPILIRGEALYWGTAALQFIPWRVYAWQILHSGELPLWNPLNGMGAPLLANYQSALLYPPVWLTYFFWIIGDVPWMAWSHTLLVVIHLIWGGIGMVLLSRQLGMSELAQAVCGACYSLCGYLVARVSFFSMIYVGSWLPWVIYFAGFIALPYKRSWSRSNLGKKHLVGLLVSVSFMLLAGHAQLSWYILLLTASWVFIGGLQENGLRRGMLSLLRFCGVVLGAVGLSSIQLLPTAEYLLTSYRSRGVDYSTAMSYSFWPWRLITFLAPDFFGNPGRGDYWGYANYWEDAIYLGVFPFLLSVFTVITILKKKIERESDIGYRNFGVYLLGVLIIGLFLALGKNNPIYYYLYRYVPTFSMFNAPSRWLILVEFAMILLAGLGLDRVRAPQGKTLYWMRLGTAGGIAVTLSSLLARIFLPDVASTFVRSVAIAGIWFICSGLLLLYVPNVALKKRRFIWPSLVIGIVLFDLLIAHWSLNPSIPIEFYKRGVSNLGLESNFSAVKRHYLSAADEYLLKFNRFLRFVDYNPIEDRENIRHALIPNLNLLDGIPSVNNFDPLVPYRYRTLMDKIEKFNGGNEKTAWLRSLGVGLIEKLDINQPLGISFEQLDGADLIGWANCAIHAQNSQEALELLEKTVEQFDQVVIIEDYDGETFSNDCLYPKAGKVRVIDMHSGSFWIEVAAERRGWLVVRNSWYPGWEARVDGQEVTVYRANYLFKAIQVDSGLHIISFSYRPLSFYLGGVLSLLGWLLLGMIILFRRPRE